MAQISLYNQEGAETGTLAVSDRVFGAPLKSSVVHQVYTAIMANRRRPWADTKDRGEVSGGGKKPWKQKGTGRARHGSIRSPIWKGGGVTFGPLSVRNYKQKINKKMNQAAMRMCVSSRAAEEHFVAVEDFPADGKTKVFAALREKLPGAGRTTLLLVRENGAAERATRNIPKLTLARAADANVADILKHQYVIATKGAVEDLEKRLGKQ